MKILITGAKGYIGKSLHIALKNKYEITSITRLDFDLTDKEATDKWFKGKFFDVVIHTAIKGGSRLKPDNGDIFYQNLQMFYNLFYNKHCFGKLIHFGSGAELGRPIDPYGLSKKIINNLIQSEPNFYNIRIFAVFDENEWDTRFIKTNIRHYINNEDIIIHQNKLMDFIYMSDLIKIVEYYINNNNNPKEINCNYSISYSLLDIANIINSLNNHKVNINIQQEKFGEPYKDSYINLGIKFTGLKQGIKETYNKLKNK